MEFTELLSKAKKIEDKLDDNYYDGYGYFSSGYGLPNTTS